MRTRSSGPTQLFSVKPYFFVKATNDFKLKNHLINLSESLNGFHLWKVECLTFLTHYQPPLYDLYIKSYPHLKFKITTVSQLSPGLSCVCYNFREVIFVIIDGSKVHNRISWIVLDVDSHHYISNKKVLSLIYLIILPIHVKDWFIDQLFD